jgi:hypothetical protein
MKQEGMWKNTTGLASINPYFTRVAVWDLL